MEHAIWLFVLLILFVGGVLGGFWVIAKAEFPKIVSWLFGGIVLIIIAFALVMLVRSGGNPHLMFDW